MASIRILVDTFGPPPREICLDWAYQIQLAADSLTAAAAPLEMPDQATNEAHEETPLAAAWTSFEVTSDGCLQLEGLTVSMARLALEELRQWADEGAVPSIDPSDGAWEEQSRESEPTADTFGACGTLNHRNSNCEGFQRHATRKRGAQSGPIRLIDRRVRLTAAGAVLALGAAILIGLGISEDGSTPETVTKLTGTSAERDHTTARNSKGGERAASSVTGDDFLPTHDNDALLDTWTTSAELTGGVLDATTVHATDRSNSSTPPMLGLAPAPSLAARPKEATETQPTDALSAPSDARDAQRTPSVKGKLGSETHTDGAKDSASLEINDVMNQVATAIAQAEKQGAGDADQAPLSPTGSEAAPASESHPTGTEDPTTAMPAIMLTRDAGVLRYRIPRGLRRLREPHWTARIELADGFVCEPTAVQSVDARTGAHWRIYEKSAQSPRACLIVSVHRQSAREADLEWSLRGSADDLPTLRLPVARKWLDAVSAQLKITAASLQGLMESSTQNVPRELKTLVQNQRQLARQQLAVAQRLLTLLAEVDHLASLLDDELLCHAELRESDGGALLAAYGSCELEPAAAEPAAAEAASAPD